MGRFNPEQGIFDLDQARVDPERGSGNPESLSRNNCLNLARRSVETTQSLADILASPLAAGRLSGYGTWPARCPENQAGGGLPRLRRPADHSFGEGCVQGLGRLYGPSCRDVTGFAP